MVSPVEPTPAKTAEQTTRRGVQLAAPTAQPTSEAPLADHDVVFECRELGVRYGRNRALRDVNLEIREHGVTALIGPSGCGKSTFLRCLNRMNDLIPSAAVDGTCRYYGEDLYAPSVDAIEVRKRIGMVFQKPNPFPKSVIDNIAFGPRVLGMTSNLADRVEQALRRAALWDEVKDRLRDGALGLSGGQQQRLCIARALAVEPDVLLMDEPCSALDPISTAAIEDLMTTLKSDYTVVIVTHNMQQAARVADQTAFFSVDQGETGRRCGVLIEMSSTDRIFTNPDDPRTEAYVTGRFG